MKRGDTLSKIAKRHHVKGGWKGFVEAEQEDDQEPKLDLHWPGYQDQIDLTGAGGTLPPSKPTRGSPADPHLPGFRFFGGLPNSSKSAGCATEVLRS